MPSKSRITPPGRSNRPHRWWVLVAVAVGLIVIAAVRVGQGIPAAGAPTAQITLDQPGGWQIGEQAPAVHATTTGGPFILPAGKPAILSFAAAWCNPVVETSALARIERDFGERVAILGVGVDPSEPLAELRDFAGRLGAGYGFVHDRDGTLAGALRVRALDSTVVVDATGRIVYRDAVPTNEATLRAALAKAGS
jgi:Redoxin